MTIRPLRLIISAATVVVLLVGNLSSQVGLRSGIGKAEAKSLTNASLSPTLSVSSNLANRRYAAAGDRAYDLGSEDGRYPAMGFHTRGEMGGIWTPPIKLLDGIWFGVNGQWIGPATSFTSGFGDRKSTRLNSSHQIISYAVFCLKKKTNNILHVTVS